ncbi:glucose-6-phosphate isomerase [Canibacter sp. lx-45]|uniref:glucose-6-phosphate isomerase n=1 Tax=Canibacter zhuwentaonis TaxID=2837491 RepID=UPI001BDC1A57|nr:glucose-6-phosphate isomerase [Canibacter zhuwentaonis]MBT1035658.1 glucose-6-phosphate isomerase [Canibacter zhuwentaonis]
MRNKRIEFGSGIWQQAYHEAMQRLLARGFASALAKKDAGLWGAKNAAESAIRMGWLDFAERADEIIAAAAEHRALLNSRGINQIVLCGMGGSSLAPEVISEYCNVGITILDSSHPAQVASALNRDLHSTAVVVSSKSGSTIETRSHLETFERAFQAAGIDPDERIIIITDPGSALAEKYTATKRRVYLADPNVGGRFSALIAFGLVPPTLAGAELAPIVSEAEQLLPKLLQNSPENPALQLAARLYAALPQKMCCAIIANQPELAGFGDWIEQLVAESTGKHGRGVLPISITPQSSENTLFVPNNMLRIFIDHPVTHLASDDVLIRGGIGEIMILWMVATTALCYLLEVCPFDQPDVESAKIAARKHYQEVDKNTLANGTALSDCAATQLTAGPTESSLRGIYERITTALSSKKYGYLVVQLYFNRTAENICTAEKLRSALAAKLRVPVSATFGPRYLHSTGQLHKGGPQQGLFLQIIDLPQKDTQLPEVDAALYSRLLLAQPHGDAAVLRRHDPDRVIQLITTDAGKLIQLLQEFTAQ